MHVAPSTESSKHCEGYGRVEFITPVQWLGTDCVGPLIIDWDRHLMLLGVNRPDSDEITRMVLPLSSISNGDETAKSPFF